MNTQNALAAAKTLLEQCGRFLAQKASDGKDISTAKLDAFQGTAYDLAWVASEVYAAEQVCAYADKHGELEKALAEYFTAEMVANFSQKVSFHFHEWGVDQPKLVETIWKPELTKGVEKVLAADNVARIAQLIKKANHGGSYGLDENHQMFRETFKKFAEDKVAPLAEKVHRHDLLIPQEIIDGLKELGCFGLSIPQAYGGFQDDAKPDNTGMCVVTEELSRGSLGVAGSLITRPEILSKAILKGGTDAQKQKWLPLLASGERMAGVAVTEPDYGSDVAGMKVTARPQESKGQKGWVINGVKTWCTFAGYADTLMVLCRTDPDIACSAAAASSVRRPMMGSGPRSSTTPRLCRSSISVVCSARVHSRSCRPSSSTCGRCRHIAGLSATMSAVDCQTFSASSSTRWTPRSCACASRSRSRSPERRPSPSIAKAVASSVSRWLT